jgi:hypothetical protein
VYICVSGNWTAVLGGGVPRFFGGSIMKRLGLCGLLLFASIAIPPAGGRPAEAFQGFRCETGRLVREGDRGAEVRLHCGEPDFADSHEEKRTVRRTVWTWVAGLPVANEEEVTISVIVDEWTYDLGPNRFIRHLAFEQDRLVRVWTSGRGSPR